MVAEDFLVAIHEEAYCHIWQLGMEAVQFVAR